MAWNTSSAPFDVPAGAKHFRPMTIVVAPNGGAVQVQFRDNTGAWVTPTDAAYTLTQAGPVRIERANTPMMRVIATGAAAFEVTLEA